MVGPSAWGRHGAGAMVQALLAVVRDCTVLLGKVSMRWAKYRAWLAKGTGVGARWP